MRYIEDSPIFRITSSILFFAGDSPKPASIHPIPETWCLLTNHFPINKVKSQKVISLSCEESSHYYELPLM